MCKLQAESFLLLDDILEMCVLVQVVEPLADDILAYMDQWDGTTKVTITVPALMVVLSPATVRLILNSVHSLDIGHVSTLSLGPLVSTTTTYNVCMYRVKKRR